MPTFKAFQIRQDEGQVSGKVVETSLGHPGAGEVIVHAAYSSVNYKDALAATGAGKILKRFPLIGGIDVAGTIAASGDSRFGDGDRVIVTGYDLGVATDGGYAEYVRVPGEWIVPLPEGLTLFDAMTLGTAGFTAGLAIERLEINGLRPGAGPVAVTGATGGVGSVAIAALRHRGYAVTAITGKEDEHNYLRRLGAEQVLSRLTLDRGTRPLEKATWAGAVDAAGGDLLAWLVRTTNYWGSVASTGLTGGTDVHLTVLPFILRGVSVIGIDSVMCPMAIRRQVWRRLASDLKPSHLRDIAREITLDQLPEAFETLLHGRARGRFVVNLTGT